MPGVSIRTPYAAFRKTLCMRPHTYLQIIRLHHLRKQLIRIYLPSLQITVFDNYEVWRHGIRKKQ